MGLNMTWSLFGFRVWGLASIFFASGACILQKTIPMIVSISDRK